MSTLLSGLLSMLLFALGIHMMVMLLAAGYRYVDLWYRIGDFWPGITLRLLVLLGLDAALLNLMPAARAEPFAWGQFCYLIFHIGIFWITQLGLWIALKQRDR